jgi:diacylglycerol kinase
MQKSNSDSVSIWSQKFGHAIRGVKIAVWNESSLRVHWLVTIGVILTGMMLELTSTSWCLLTLCIVVVLMAEMFNTAIERVCQVITQEQNHQIRDALDISAGAVLLVAVGAVIVGILVLVGPLR